MSVLLIAIASFLNFEKKLFLIVPNSTLCCIIHLFVGRTEKEWDNFQRRGWPWRELFTCLYLFWKKKTYCMKKHNEIYFTQNVTAKYTNICMHQVRSDYAGWNPQALSQLEWPRKISNLGPFVLTLNWNP